MTDDLITVRTFEFLGDAEAAKMHLEAQGIPAILGNVEIANMHYFLGQALGGIPLQVRRQEVPQTIVLLDQLPGAPGEPEGGSDRSDTLLCLECGARISEGQTSCPACGWSYRKEGGELDEGTSVSPIEQVGPVPDHTPGTLDALWAVKRSVFWFFLLLPALVVGCGLVFSITAMSTAAVVATGIILGVIGVIAVVLTLINRRFQSAGRASCKSQICKDSRAEVSLPAEGEEVPSSLENESFAKFGAEATDQEAMEFLRELEAEEPSQHPKPRKEDIEGK
jgi:hypothetical protein